MTKRKQLIFFMRMLDRLQSEVLRLEAHSPSSGAGDDFSDTEEIHRNLGTAVAYVAAIVARLQQAELAHLGEKDSR